MTGIYNEDSRRQGNPRSCVVCEKSEQIMWRVAALEKDFEFMKKMLTGTFVTSLTSLAVLLISLYFNR